MAKVLITGTSKGIGYDMPLLLARAGHQVVATMRNPGASDLPQYDASTIYPRLRFPVGPDAYPFLSWRGASSDEDWVGLGGIASDADYFERVFIDTGVDLRSA